MLEILQYIFSSFWIWLGTVLLVNASSANVLRIIRKTAVAAREKAKDY